MTAWSSAQNDSVKNAIQFVLKLWACATLFMTAALLKTLLAKLLASKFNKESHSQKIQDCLVKEYYLHMLLQPRQRNLADTQGETESSVDKNTICNGLQGLGASGLHAIYAGSRNIEHALVSVHISFIYIYR